MNYFKTLQLQLFASRYMTVVRLCTLANDSGIQYGGLVCSDRHIMPSTLAKPMFAGCWLVETVNLNAYVVTMLRARRPRLCRSDSLLFRISA